MQQIFLLVPLLLATLTSRCCANEPDPIKLSQVWTTTAQRDLRQIQDVLRPDGQNSRNSVRDDFLLTMKRDNGSSNIVFLPATDAFDAVRATTRYLESGASASRVQVNERAKKLPSTQLWLMVYMGRSHSEPLAWHVEKVDRSNQHIRVSYRNPKLFLATRDITPYYYWIPLGKLEKGAYRVELFDTDEKETTLMRRIIVE